MDSTIDAIGVLELGSTVLLPASLMLKKDIVVGGRYSVPTPLWPDLEGNAVVFEDFPGCTGCAIGPPLIGRSRVSEASAILRSAYPRNRFLAMTVELNKSSSKAFS